MGSIGLRDRTKGAAIALFVQVGFVAILMASLAPDLPSHRAVSETIWVLPRLVAPDPQVIDARGKTRARGAAIGPAPPVPSISDSNAPTTIEQASPPGIQSLGQALFGCAPEKYADLSAEQRTHCRAPGEGMAKLDGPSLIAPPSRAKDEATWQEDIAEARWSPMCFNAQSVVDCISKQVRDERLRAQAVRLRIADAKAAAIREAKRPLPANIGMSRQ